MPRALPWRHKSRPDRPEVETHGVTPQAQALQGGHCTSWPQIETVPGMHSQRNRFCHRQRCRYRPDSSLPYSTPHNSRAQVPPGTMPFFPFLLSCADVWRRRGDRDRPASLSPVKRGEADRAAAKSGRQSRRRMRPGRRRTVQRAILSSRAKNSATATGDRSRLQSARAGGRGAHPELRTARDAAPGVGV